MTFCSSPNLAQKKLLWIKFSWSSFQPCLASVMNLKFVGEIFHGCSLRKFSPSKILGCTVWKTLKLEFVDVLLIRSWPLMSIKKRSLYACAYSASALCIHWLSHQLILATWLYTMGEFWNFNLLCGQLALLPFLSLPHYHYAFLVYLQYKSLNHNYYCW